MPKVVEHIQQKNIRQKEQKESYTGSAKITPKIKIKEDPIHKKTYTGRYGTRLEERLKERNSDFAMHQTKTLNINSQPENQYAIASKRTGTLRKVVDLKSKNNKKQWNYGTR